MKKITLIMTIVFLLILSFPQTVYAEMYNDIDSMITVQKNNEISMTSEVLDISVAGTSANISALYKMKNTTDKSVSAPFLFLAPNVDEDSIIVYVNDKQTDFKVQTNIVKCTEYIEIERAQLKRLMEKPAFSTNVYRDVAEISFDMSFEPQQEYYVKVSYTYNLDGFIMGDFRVNEPNIDYYFKSETMWGDLSDLTINLKLDKEMPVIKSSNINFNKVGENSYQYKSDTLKKKQLMMVIDYTWYHKIFGIMTARFRSFSLVSISPFILAAVLIVFFSVRKRRKRRNETDDNYYTKDRDFKK